MGGKHLKDNAAKVEMGLQIGDTFELLFLPIDWKGKPR